MNILFFTSEYNHAKTPNSGGIGTFVKTIASGLVAKGHKVYVFGFHKKPLSFIDNSIVVEFCKKSPSVFLDKILRKLLKKKNYKETIAIMERVYWTFRLIRFVKNKNIDIIEAYDYGGFFSFFNYLKIPIVIRSHGSLGLLKRYFGYNHIKEDIVAIEKKAFKKFDNILAVSEFSKTIIGEYYKKENIEVVYNGVDTKFFKPNYKIAKQDKSIYYFGTISEKKGLQELAKVFNSVIEIYPSATLHLIGRGDVFFEFLKKNIFTKKAIKNTIYYGRIDHSKLPSTLSKAHIIIFPSHGENFPFCFLEAMALEKPVIVSNIEVSKEIIDHGVNGYIAKDKIDYINYITAIFKSNNSNIAINARKTVMDKFSLVKMTENTLKYYQKIIDEK